MNFQIGDIVMLKSGGPDMTVIHIDRQGGDVWCTWFVGALENPHKAGFPPAALKKC